MKIRIPTVVTILMLAAFSSPCLAAYKEGMDALAVRDYARARAEFEQDRSEPKAVFELSRMARLGLGEPANESRATSLLGTAAEMGHGAARMEYAFALGNGNGIDKDPARAIKLFEGLSAEGNTQAQVELGRALRYGWWGLAKEEARAAGLFLKAMEKGNDDGRLQYALCLTHGIGVTRNEARAAELLRPSADRGHVDSQTEYARMLSFGIGLPKDEAAGTALYQKTAESSNNRIAQYNLGMAYLLGRGVPKDEKTAARWMDAAARQGWGSAQLQLADMFRLGIGVPRVRNEAYFWYSIAARGTSGLVVDRANNQRTDMARDMSEADLKRLSARAEAFRVQAGFRPRMAALPPLARGDLVELGAVSLKIPLPKGYINAWETVEWLQQAYPNDPEQKPWLMVLSSQEDIDRIKMGLRGGLRRVELSRHLSDDSITVTPRLFGEIKGQLKSTIESAVSNGRYRSEGVVHDEDNAFSFVRSGVTEPNLVDALAFVLVKDKVLVVAITGFTRDQKPELTALVRSIADEVQSANRPGFFSR